VQRLVTRAAPNGRHFSPALMLLRHRWRLLPVVVLLSLLPALLTAQDRKEVFSHAVFWSKLELNDFLDGGRWGWGLDGIVRRKNEEGTGSMFDAPLRESIRPWVHYQFSKNARFSLSPLGYMHTTEYVGVPEDRLRDPYHELRTTFQFFHHHKQLDGRLMHTFRYRYELRWQERANADDYRYTNRFRVRYRARYMLNGNDFYRNHTAYLMVSNEIGLNMGREVVWNTFNQNRVYAGVGVRFATAARAELRYVDRFRTRGATGFQFDHGRGLMLAVYVDELRRLRSRDIPQVRFVD
jgi:hypothetical protein